jgi:hypothetical protein
MWCDLDQSGALVSRVRRESDVTGVVEISYQALRCLTRDVEDACCLRDGHRTSVGDHLEDRAHAHGQAVVSQSGLDRACGVQGHRADQAHDPIDTFAAIDHTGRIQ